MKDYYAVLNIGRDANKDVIKQAFKKLAKKYHPDLNSGDSSAEEKFKEINEAYSTLNNDNLRKEYDIKLNSMHQPLKQNSDSESNYKNENFDFRSVEKSFENYFGFNPKNNDNLNKREKKKNPIDTSDLFEQYFKIRKK